MKNQLMYRVNFRHTYNGYFVIIVCQNDKALWTVVFHNKRYLILDKNNDQKDRIVDILQNHTNL